MFFRLEHLEASAAHHLGADLSRRLRECAAAVLDMPTSLVEVLDDSMAGELILRAALDRPEGLPNYPACQAAIISTVAESVFLRPEEVMIHPLLVGWAGRTLADAVGAPFLSGSRLMRLAITAPAYGSIKIASEGERVCGGAQMTFDRDPQLISSAVIHYGEELDAGCLSVELSGDALFGMGREARLGRVLAIAASGPSQVSLQGSTFH